jgi:tungstate transport system substrate-binding protein
MAKGISFDRRRFLKLATTAVAAGPALLAGRGAFAATEVPGPVKEARSDVVRVASVTTAVEGGVLPALAEGFRRETGLELAISAGDEPYGEAEAGMADLVISHFGHKDTERFVLAGLGLWPRTVFSNQLGLFGPRSDPAGIRGLTSLVQAFGQIARAKAPYVVNATHGLRYLTEILWCAAGRPARGGWFVDHRTSKGDAIALAAERGGYVLWGLTPFLREEKKRPRGLEPLLSADPLLQRLMVSVLVNPAHVRGVNAAGAARFQRYLLLPVTQARILEVHYPGMERAVWAPAGRHNAGAALPGAGRGSAGGARRR